MRSKSEEEPFPYNLPPWRRNFAATSPDNSQRASIEEAIEIGMSNPTKGNLTINGVLVLRDCSPTFCWSDDSRFLAIPKWRIGIFRKNQRLAVIDSKEQKVYVSTNKFGLITVENFTDDSFVLTSSPVRNSKRVVVPLSEIFSAFYVRSYDE